MAVTLDHVQALADQLSLIDKARLAAHLNEQLAQDLAARHATPPAAVTTSDSWDRLLAFRRDVETLGEDAPDFAAQLDADRRTRAEILEKSSRVHP